MEEFSSKLVIAFFKSYIPMILIIILIMLIYLFFIKLKRKAVNKIKNKIVDQKVEKGICPKCNGTLVERNGKYGKFTGCSNFPKCRYVNK